MANEPKADENGPVKEFDFEEWLRDGMKGFRSTVKGEIKGFDMSEFKQHVRNAQKEQLLAMRSLLDKAIDYLDKDPDKKQQA
jgi:hypothetical protein